MQFGLDLSRFKRKSNRRGAMADSGTAANTVLRAVALEVHERLPQQHPWRTATLPFRLAYFLEHVAPLRDAAAELCEPPFLPTSTDAERIAANLLERNAATAFCYRLINDQLLQTFNLGGTPANVLQSLCAMWSPVRISLQLAFRSEAPFGQGVVSCIRAVDQLLSEDLLKQLPQRIYLQFVREELQSRAQIHDTSYAGKCRALGCDADPKIVAARVHARHFLDDIATGESALELAWHRLYHAAMHDQQAQTGDEFLRINAPLLRDLLTVNLDPAPLCADAPPEMHLRAALQVEAIAGSSLSVFPSWPMPEQTEWIDELSLPTRAPAPQPVEVTAVETWSGIS